MTNEQVYKRALRMSVSNNALCIAFGVHGIPMTKIEQPEDSTHLTDPQSAKSNMPVDLTAIASAVVL